MYYSRPFHSQERASRGSNQGSSQGKDGTTTTNADGESISGMLTNFSKALGDIREIREKRMQSLGPAGQSPKPSPTMDGWNRSQQMQNMQQQQQPFRNQQQSFNQYGQQQNSNPMQRQQQQQFNQPNYRQQPNQSSQQWQQQQGMNQPNFNQQSMQQPPPAGTIQPQTSQMVVQQQQQPAQQQPVSGVVLTQPGVQLMAGSQPQVQPVVIYSSGEPLMAPTPAIFSAPTPAPLVVNTSVPMSSSTNYTFDPSGLTPAQQLAYAQAQQQHQQQHLKKMRQRLPHGGKSGSPHMSRKFDGPVVHSHLPSAALLHEAKLVGTPDTLSESGSIKSGRSRSRTLPFLPPEEPAPLPSQAKKPNDRINSNRRAYANFRQSSLDGLTSRGYGGLSRPRPSNSETNLRKLALEERNRPVSALGLLQASSVVSSHGPSAAAKEHEKRILENILPPDLRHLIRGGTSAYNSIQQIESSLRTTEKTGPSDAEIARLNAEKRLFGGQRERIVAEMQRYATMKDPRLRAEMKHKLNPVLDAQLNRNRQRRGGHRRNFSDGRISSAVTDHLGDDVGYASSMPNRPYSSMSGGYGGGHDPLAHDPLGLDNSQSYLGVEGGGGMGMGSVLRDTAISGYDNDDSNRARFLASQSRLLHRRASAGGLENSFHQMTNSDFEGYNSSPQHQQHNTRRPHSSMSGKMGTRSWHPSPFGSDDETEEHHFFKEEKKNRIKMEISRRRHQIEENARLHEELIRLAKLRESAELGADSHRLGIAGYPSPSISPGREGNSVLRSVDEILRNEHGASQYGVGGSSVHRNPGRREQGRYHDEDHIGGSFNTDRYTATVYDRVTDFSPVNSDFSNEFPHNPMPLLPDIASRSRKLIDDLNTSSGYHPSSKYATRSNFYR